MNILFCRWHSICEPDMLSAWKNLGHFIDEIHENIDNWDYSQHYLNKLSKVLMTNKYDIVFSVDFIPVVSKVCHAFRLRYVSYTVDYPALHFYSDSIGSEWNRIFIFDRNMYEQFQYKNPSNMFYLPLGANTKHMEQVCNEITPKDRRRLSSEVSFIGSLYTEKCPFNKLTNLPNKLKGYLDGVIEAQLHVYGYNFLTEVLSESIVSEFKKCTGMGDDASDYQIDYRMLIAQEFLGVKCSEQERIRLLNGLSNHYNMDFYTQSDPSLVPLVNIKGSAESRIEMPKIFHLSKINLNFTAKSIQTGISQRIWDVLAAGGFLITNYQAELPDYFERGEDLEFYDSFEDLKEKIKFYLDHEELRLKIAQNGQEKVRKYHSYEDRMTSIVSLLEF